MAINLKKGQRYSLDKSMRMALVGLGWDPQQYDGAYDFDLDASAFLLGKNGKVVSESDFIFYNNLSARNDAVRSTGDDRTGGNSDGGDDEQLIIDFTKLPPEIDKIAITVTIYEAVERNQNFGQVSNAYVRLARIEDDSDTQGVDLLRFDLEEDFSIETALVVCELYRRGNEWRFNAVGAGYQGGLAALCERFGVETA